MFVPESRARFLAQVWRALLISQTWGDLKRLAPALAYREIRKRNDDFEPSERRAHAPFDYDTMTSASDGDYPDWPEQDMLKWMPRDIQLDFGNVGVSRLNGDFLQLAPKDAKAIVQRLKQAGFGCRRNERLIEQVHGQHCEKVGDTKEWGGGVRPFLKGARRLLSSKQNLGTQGGGLSHRVPDGLKKRIDRSAEFANFAVSPHVAPDRA